MAGTLSEQSRSLSSRWVKLWVCGLALAIAAALSVVGGNVQSAYAAQAAPVDGAAIAAFDADDDADESWLTPGQWVHSAGGWWFQYEDGSYAVGYTYIETDGEGASYYFDQAGWMVTGWHYDLDFVKELWGGNTDVDITGWLYFKPSGAMAFGWEKVGGEWYLLDPDMLIGWWYVDDAWYYMNTSGAMQTGWQFINGSWYYLAGSGAMQTGWQWINGSWYYLNEDTGAMQTGWALVDDTWYYMNGSGAMQANRWIGDYYLEASGAMATNAWIGSYYVGADGKWIPNYDANTTVYWTDNGEVYHTSKDCTSLKQSDNIKSGTIAQSGKDRACKVCTR